MAIPLEEIMRDFTPAQRKKINARAAQLIAEELSLQKLRRARKLTQKKMAKKLGITTENSIGREVPADGIIIYDAVMGKYASASARIDQALLAGLPAKLYYINTPALQAFKNAIKRAQNIGRTVPMTILAEAHAGASAVIKQLYKEYGDKVDISIITNEGGQPKLSDISSVPSYNTKELLEQFQTELERQVNEGLDKDLADAFARTSFSRDLGEWSDESDDARIRSEARRRLGQDGEASRQGPSKSAGASVQKGNAPVTEETNPLLDYVKPEEAEARIRRREARKPGVGSPNNERLVLTKDGKSFAVGKIDEILAVIPFDVPLAYLTVTGSPEI